VAPASTIVASLIKLCLLTFIVFFDNLQVIHNRGAILEETHYYPFGLTMAGISSSTVGKMGNRFKFNDGTELANKEFSDGSGIELYETSFRSYDPQLGRFHQIDPLSERDESWSPFIFAKNNPVSLNDPMGLTTDTPSTGKQNLDPVVVTPPGSKLSPTTVTPDNSGSETPDPGSIPLPTFSSSESNESSSEEENEANSSRTSLQIGTGNLSDLLDLLE